MDHNATIEIDDDTDCEDVTSKNNELTPLKLRPHLLKVLEANPPPKPIQWDSFRNYVKKNFNHFYPEKVVKDAFRLLDSITRTKIEMLNESAINKIPANNSPDSSRLLTPTPNNSRLSEDELCALSEKELCEFKRDETTKKHMHYVKEMHSIIQQIKEDTTCTMCLKIKKRLDKFERYLSQNSKFISQKREERRKNKFSEGEDSSIETSARGSSEKPLAVEQVATKRQRIWINGMLQVSLPSIVDNDGNHHSPSKKKKKKKELN